MVANNWIIAMGIVIILSLFMGGLGLISGQNVFGQEVAIVYYGINIFMIIIRVVAELIVGFIAMVMIVFSSFGLGVINDIIGTDFTAQIFYNFQSQSLAGIEALYLSTMEFVREISVMNGSLFGFDITFSPSGRFEFEIAKIGDSIKGVWDGSFGWLIGEIVEGVVNIWEGKLIPN